MIPVDVYLIGGLPRSGKTTAAKSLAMRFGIPHIQLDIFYDWTRAILTQGRMSHRNFDAVSLQARADRRGTDGSARELVACEYENEAELILTGALGATTTSIRDEGAVVIDGSHVDFRWVERFRSEGWSVATVFFGYRDPLIIDRLLAEADSHRSWVGTWHRDLGADEVTMRNFFAGQVRRGEQLAIECSMRGLPFVERSPSSPASHPRAAAIAALGLEGNSAS